MKAIVKQVVRETPTIVTVVVEPETPITFRTGQTMRWRSREGTYGRLFSIASAGGDAVRELSFVVRLLPGGIVSSWVPSLQPGDSVEMTGPFGMFRFDTSDQRDIALIGGGSGISLLRAIYQDALQSGIPNTVRLLFSVRGPREIIYKDELQALERRHSNFSHALVFTREWPEGWHGHRGRITDAMLDAEFGGYEQMFYVCGPPEFVDFVEGVLRARGVPSERIKIDRWVYQ